MSLAFHRITFAYDGTISSLMENVTVHFPEPFTIPVVSSRTNCRQYCLSLKYSLKTVEQATLRGCNRSSLLPSQVRSYRAKYRRCDSG